MLFIRVDGSKDQLQGVQQLKKLAESHGSGNSARSMFHEFILNI